MNPSELNSICRSCLSGTSELRSIFKAGKICGQITKLADMLNQCTHLEFTEDDGLPGNICSKCVLHVSKAYAFIQQCIKADETLREQIKEEEAIEETITDIANHTTEELEDDELYTEYTIYDGDDMEPELLPTSDTGQEVVLCDTELINSVDSKDNGNVVNIKVETAVELHNSNSSPTQYETLMIEENLEEPDDDDVDDDEDDEITEHLQIDEDTSGVSVQSTALRQIPSPHLPPLQSFSLQSDKFDEDSSDKDIIPKMVFKKYRNRSKNAPGPPFKCEECGKVLSNHSSFKYHMQLHSEETPFLCSECGEGFKTRNAYDGHMITHVELNPHTCTVCGKSYRQAASLRCHMLTHTGEKPFTCNICGKGMTQKSGYKKHMLTHSGEKPHQCELCGKHFRYSSNLIMHKRSHSGDKPFTCDVCDKRFIGCEQLKRHKLIHTGEKPFECDICKKRFNRKSTLQVHANIHTGTRKHVCQICQKSYIQFHCLTTHLANAHDIKPETISSD